MWSFGKIRSQESRCRFDIKEQLWQSAPHFLDYQQLVPLIQNYYGDIPLHLTARKDSIESANLLIHHVKDIDKLNAEGYSALMESAWYDSAKVTKLLIDHGAYLKNSIKGGETALCIAKKRKSENVIRLISEKTVRKSQVSSVNS